MCWPQCLILILKLKEFFLLLWSLPRWFACNVCNVFNIYNKPLLTICEMAEILFAMTLSRIILWTRKNSEHYFKTNIEVLSSFWWGFNGIWIYNCKYWIHGVEGSAVSTLFTKLSMSVIWHSQFFFYLKNLQLYSIIVSTSPILEISSAL